MDPTAQQPASAGEISSNKKPDIAIPPVNPLEKPIVDPVAEKLLSSMQTAPTETPNKAFVSQTPPQQPAAPAPTKKKHTLLWVGLIVVFLLLLSGGGAVAAAYNIIQLPNENIQKSLSYVVMKIPLMPKTPWYILQSSLDAHEKITTASMDASVSVSLGASGNSLGLSSFDAKISGPFDYTDPLNPTFDISAQITKDFAFDVKTKNHVSYFRVKAFPSYLTKILAAYGYPEESVTRYTDKWFSYEDKTLQTEASQNLKSQQKTFDKQSARSLIDFFNDPSIKKSVSMGEDTIDNASVYLIHFYPDDAALDAFVRRAQLLTPSSTPGTKLPTRPSETLNAFKMDMWVDKSSYLVRKLSVTANLKNNYPSSAVTPLSAPALPTPLQVLGAQTQLIPVSFVIHFTNYNEKVSVDIPTDATKFEDLMADLVASSAAKISSSSAQQKQKKDTPLKSY
jgi:hypothetical protein